MYMYIHVYVYTSLYRGCYLPFKGVITKKSKQAIASSALGEEEVEVPPLDGIVAAHQAAFRFLFQIHATDFRQHGKGDAYKKLRLGTWWSLRENEIWCCRILPLRETRVVSCKMSLVAPQELDGTFHPGGSQ